MAFKSYKLRPTNRGICKIIAGLKDGEIVYVHGSIRRNHVNVYNWTKKFNCDFEYQECKNGGFILRTKPRHGAEGE
jgi:hypothetical protein